MENEIERTTTNRIFIKSYSSISNEEMKKIVESEKTTFFSFHLDYEPGCESYSIVYYDKKNDAEVIALVKRVEKKLLELVKLRHNLYLLGVCK